MINLSLAAALVVLIDVSLVVAIRLFVDDYHLAVDPRFFPSVVGRPELSNVIEPRDRLYSVLTVGQPLVIALSLLTVSQWRRNLQKVANITTISISIGISLVLVSLVGWTDTRPLYASWKGFGIGRFLVCLMCVVGIFVPAVGSHRMVRALRIWLGTAGVALLVSFLPYFLQFKGSVRDTYHSRFIIDELLAAASGSSPLVDYTAQYTQLFGLALTPILTMFERHAVQIAVCTISALQITCVFLVWLTFRRLVGGVWSIGVTLIVVVSILSAAPGSSLGATVVSYWAVMPIRTIGPLVVLFVSTFLDSERTSRPFLLGVVGALVALNNPDWGIPALLGLLCSVVVTSIDIRMAARRFGRAVIGSSITVAGLLGILLLWGTPELSRLFEFARLFGTTGYFAVPTLSWGIHLAVFGTHVACLFIGIAISPIVSRKVDFGMLSSAMTTAGFAGLGAFLYFVNRSLTAVLASTFMFWSISICLLLIFQIRITPIHGAAVRWWLGVPVLLLVSLATSVFQPPKPFGEIPRLRGEYPGMNFDLDRANMARIEQIDGLINSLGASPGQVGVIGLDSSWLALRTGTQNLTNYNSIQSIVTFSQMRRLCTGIQRADVTHIIVTDPPAAPEVLDVLGECTQLKQTVPFFVFVPSRPMG